jgi:hypothetical protein
MAGCLSSGTIRLSLQLAFLTPGSSTLEGEKAATRAVVAAAAAHREEFEFERYPRGPNLRATPSDIIAQVEI